MRKLLTVVIAILAAMMFTPAAQATDPGNMYEVIVEGQAYGDFDVVAVNKTPLSVIVEGVEPELELECSTATAEGILHSNSPVPDPYLEFLDDTEHTTTFSGCDVQGIDVTVTLDCPLQINAVPNPAQSVHMNLSDTNVTGELVAEDGSGNGCVHVKDNIGGAGCDMTIKGMTNADFDETRKDVDGVDWQDLTISGNGLQVDTINGVCAGLIPANAHFDFSVTFNVRVTRTHPGHVAVSHTPSPNGSINFRPDPNAED